MPEVDVPVGFGSVNLDVCPHCQFIWFDATEYERLPTKAVEPGWRQTLSQETRERIAMAQVQAIEAQYGDANIDSPMPDEWWKIIPAIFGLPVEHETRSVFRVPLATWCISAAVLIVSVVAFTDLAHAASAFGLVPDRVTRLWGLTFATSFFLHAGWRHLLGNLYFLLVLGDNVEERLGAWKFLSLLALATLAGGIAHVLGDPRSTVPCIGASGGISGVMAYYAFAFPKTRLAFFVLFRWIRVPAAVMFVLWIALQIYGARAQLAGVSSVSSLAHLGGAGVGVLFWWLTRPGRE